MFTWASTRCYGLQPFSAIMHKATPNHLLYERQKFIQLKKCVAVVTLWLCEKRGAKYETDLSLALNKAT